MDIKDELFLEALRFRFACKKFDASKKINEKDFQTILEAGRLSPSSFGFEPWEFIVAQNRELREEIRAVSWGAQGQLPTASHFIIILARMPESMSPDSSYIQNTIMREMSIEAAEAIASSKTVFPVEGMPALLKSGMATIRKSVAAHAMTAEKKITLR